MLYVAEGGCVERAMIEIAWVLREIVLDGRDMGRLASVSKD